MIYMSDVENKEVEYPPCPSCGRTLEDGPLKRYETGIEHVFDVNKYNEHPPKPRGTFICANENCERHGKGYFDKYEANWYSNEDLSNDGPIEKEEDQWSIPE